MPRCRRMNLEVCIGLFVVSLTWNAQSTFGDEPEEGVIRTFAVFANSLENLPDFSSEDSQAVIVGPSDPTSSEAVFRFDSFSSCDSSLDGTVWPITPAMHIVRGREELGTVAWLLTPDTPDVPPEGTITFTGSENSMIIEQEVFWVEQGLGAGTLRVRCSPGGSAIMLVVTARFLR